MGGKEALANPLGGQGTHRLSPRVPDPLCAPSGDRESSPLPTILSMNIGHLFPNCNQTKPAQLAGIVSEEKALVLGLSETWLTPEILDTEIHIEDFSLYRADRKSRQGGGVALYIREGVTSVPFIQFSNSVVEVVGIKVQDMDSLIICAPQHPGSTII